MHTFPMFETSPIIAVIRKPPKEHVFSLVEALLKGGVTNLELTMQEHDSADTIHELVHRYGKEAWIGAGTVIDEAQAAAAVQAGASFIFSPNMDRRVIQTAKKLGAVSIPGVLTPTEALQAVEAGADCVKVFPASAFGPRYIKELKGPLPHVPIIPTGGIDRTNIADFREAGAIACGLGGSLVDRKLIDSGNFSELTSRAEELVALAGGHS
ncbi:bifunctional 4-hydroxy-2-oxoglutarate aldolase/2-dehydro-3-deoxy-phosphogluconate aldolase [Alkalicoccus luteus]